MRASAWCILVSPTGDNNETARGRLTVVQNNQPAQTIYRGVVVHVGCQVREGTDEEPFEKGCVAHYAGFHEVGEMHVVPHANLIAWEPA